MNEETAPAPKKRGRRPKGVTGTAPVARPRREKIIDPFDGDDDARTDWNTSRLNLVWMGTRLGSTLYLVRCFDRTKLVFEHIYVDDEIAREAGKDWRLMGRGAKATLREISLGPDGISIQPEVTL